MSNDSENVAYVIPVEYVLHTPGKPFCYDETCACHEDETLIAEVAQHIQDGLMSAEEATAFVKGAGI